MTRIIIKFIKFSRLIVSIGLLLIDNSFSNESTGFPQKIEIIEKQNARYDSPEHTYTALISSLMKRDIDWYWETSTTESANQSKQSYIEAGISPDQIFDTVSLQEEYFIMNKIPYKDGFIIIVRCQDPNGTVMEGPSIFIKDGSDYKSTNIYSLDEELHAYLKYFKRTSLDTTQIIASFTGVRYDRRTRRFYCDATITNTSGQDFEGPVWLKIKNLQPKNASVINPDGMHFDEPYLIMLSEEEKWPAGKTLPLKTIYFSNPEKQRISFDDQVFAVIPENNS